MWLDDARGNAVDWSTQRWVQFTGRRVNLAETPWLDGPIGPADRIGADVFTGYAARHALQIAEGRPAGLVPDLACLAAPDFHPPTVSPDVRHFYERTSEYEVDAWSHWCGAFRPFGWALAVIFSRRLQQLNVPLSGLETSRGMTSEVRPVISSTGALAFTSWVRQLVGTGNVIYAGAYSTCQIPGHDGRCVRVVFPLPNGNATVIMRPVAHADGSVTLVSAGAGFGSPGFYFTVHGPNGRVWGRYLRAMRETIHVYSSASGVRADHVLKLWGITFLRLHYRLRQRG